MNSMMTGKITALIAPNQTPRKGCIVKKLTVTILGIMIIVATKAVMVHAGESGGIPLRAGKSSASVQGNFAVCLDPSTFELESCSTSGALVFPLSLLQNGSSTSDNQGNSCASYTEVDTALPPSTLPPNVTTNEHNVGRILDYDAKSGTGDVSSKGYVGGQCNGATFDSTGATQTSSGTAHFVLSHDGNRSDFIVTEVTNPSNSLGSFSISGFNLRQTTP